MHMHVFQYSIWYEIRCFAYFCCGTSATNRQERGLQEIRCEARIRIEDLMLSIKLPGKLSQVLWGFPSKRQQRIDDCFERSSFCWILDVAVIQAGRLWKRSTSIEASRTISWSFGCNSISETKKEKRRFEIYPNTLLTYFHWWKAQRISNYSKICARKKVSSVSIFDILVFLTSI